jgi:hypothetical protein
MNIEAQDAANLTLPGIVIPRVRKMIVVLSATVLEIARTAGRCQQGMCRWRRRPIRAICLTAREAIGQHPKLSKETMTTFGLEEATHGSGYQI